MFMYKFLQSMVLLKFHLKDANICLTFRQDLLIKLISEEQ